MKFNSKYSHGKEVNALQYIVELICENKAKKDKISLPEKFWLIDKWKNFYKSQLKQCSKFLKKHSELKIIDFIKKKHIYNLHASWIEEALEKHNFVEPDSNIKEETYNRETINETGIEKQNNNSIYNKLKNL